jgi:L-fuconate dehydratase
VTRRNPSGRIAVDANQRRDAATAVRWVRELARYDVWWIEEPTSPDFVDPVLMRAGRYLAPTAPGLSAQIHQASIDAYRLPAGSVWADVPM